MLDELLRRRVLFFGGKGGVGKTTLAAAIAQYAAAQGQNTLLVSTDPAHSTGDILETPLGNTPVEVDARFWALEIDPTAEADRYIQEVKTRVADATPPRLIAEVERQIDIARLTPGAEESALFDRFAAIVESEGARFDRLIFDTAPLGHTLRLLTLPEHMHVWMKALIGRRKKVNALRSMWRNVAGTARDERADHDRVLDLLEARRARFARVRSLLVDAQRTAFVLVLVPERLPILETRKAADALRAHGIPIGAVIVNRVLPDRADGDFLARRRERQQVYLDQIARELGAFELLRVELQTHDVVGRKALHRVITALH